MRTITSNCEFRVSWSADLTVNRQVERLAQHVWEARMAREHVALVASLRSVGYPDPELSARIGACYRCDSYPRGVAGALTCLCDDDDGGGYPSVE